MSNQHIVTVEHFDIAFDSVDQATSLIKLLAKARVRDFRDTAAPFDSYTKTPEVSYEAKPSKVKKGRPA